MANKKIKILLIGGHGSNDVGAVSDYGIERDETRKIINEMVKQFKDYNGAEITVYPTNRNCYDDVVKGIPQVDFSSFDYVFEVHFNSHANANSNGTEIFVTHAETGVAVEQKVVNNLASLGFVNRGVKRENFAVIYSAKRKRTSTALVEVCFISNKGNMDIYKAKFKEVCAAMVNGIAEGFELEKIKREPEWVESDKGWWYDLGDGTYPTNKWLEIKGEWYYFDEKGYAYKNKWLKHKEKWYWLDNDCKMVKSCILEIDKKYYAFNSDGSMKQGSIAINKDGQIIL